MKLNLGEKTVIKTGGNHTDPAGYSRNMHNFKPFPPLQTWSFWGLCQAISDPTQSKTKCLYRNIWRGKVQVTWICKPHPFLLCFKSLILNESIHTLGFKVRQLTSNWTFRWIFWCENKPWFITDIWKAAFWLTWLFVWKPESRWKGVKINELKSILPIFRSR